MKTSNFERKYSTLLSIVTWIVLGKQNQQVQKVYQVHVIIKKKNSLLTFAAYTKEETYFHHHRLLAVLKGKKQNN